MTQRRSWAFVVTMLVASIVMLPPGVAAVGAILGGLSSLLAVGIVLAYRAHRFINVGHASLGAVAGSFVTYLVAHVGWSFWVAYPLGLAAGGALGVGAGILLGERLAEASRTVVLAGSLALAFVFGSAHVAMGLTTGSVLAFEVPIPISLDVFPVRLGGTHLFAAITVPLGLAGVWSFLQRSDIGLRVRALAGDARHARRIGVDPHRTWRLLWLVIGVLAAAAGIVSQPLLGTTVARGPLLGPLLLALTAAAVGGMRDLPLTAGACVALGVAHHAILWRSPIAAAADIALFIVMVIAFALRGSKDRLDERHDLPRHRLVRSLRPLPDRLRRVGILARVCAAATTVVSAAIVLPAIAPGDAQRVGAVGVFVLAGLCVHVVATFRGSLTLGGWALVGVGATIAARVGGGSLAGVAFAVGAASAASVVLALLAARGGALAYPAVTLAFAFAFAAIATRLPVGAVGVRSIGPIVLDDPANVSLAIVAAAVIAALGVAFLRRTRIGRGALALREDPRLAAVHGVSGWRTMLAVDAIAGGIAGLAGALYLWNQRVIHPDAFGALRSLELIAMTIVGGIGSVIGPFLGAATVKGSELFASGPLHLLATGVGVLIVVMWLRGGLVSLAGVVRSRLAFRSATLDVPEHGTVDVTARFCPAPVAETRKARHDPVVRQLATTALLAGVAGGIALRTIAGDRDASVVVWLAAATIALGSVGAAYGHARPRLAAGAGVGVLATALALAAPSMLLVPVASGWVVGAALRRAASGVPQSLVHASRGWIATQAGAGAVVGAAVLAPSGGRAWLFAASVACAIVASVVLPPPGASPAHQRPPGTVIGLAGASLSLGGTQVLRDAELHVRPGEIVGVVGSNGVGKTTLLRAIAGEARLDGGAVFVRHTDATVLAPDERSRLGVMLSDADDGSNGELTVRENLRLAVLAAHPRASAKEVIALAGRLHPCLVDRLDDRAAVLSGGERRLLALAQIAIVQPSVLLVDELARGLSATALAVYRTLLLALAKRGTAIVVVDHDVHGLRGIADRVVRLAEGRLVPDDTTMAPNGRALSRATT